MKPCPTCGNEISNSEWKCPFCESQIHAAGGTGRKKGAGDIRTVNIEKGMPTVEEAIQRLDRELRSAKGSQVKVLRIIHGYGSTGTGGKIKQRVSGYLSGMMKKKMVRYYIEGEDYSDISNAGAGLLSRHPKLRSTLRSDTENPGITFVEF